MGMPIRLIVVGAAAGLLISAGIALANTGTDAITDPIVEAIVDNSPKGFDTSTLVKFKDKDYLVVYDRSVSADVISSHTVTKIAGGKVSYVTIGTTSSGTYSSDALTSRHVRYPGVSVSEITKAEFAALENSEWQRIVPVRSRSIQQVSQALGRY